ncbi:uncharacterized protein LOC120351040 [Nilaparvata lugens]|uniref:uncharacterized protein LOC120351040 n=1 Tax=Nilaparvata lugens TaxID=108931 RepID=UPI00193DF98C|nr:uncharacterized protein LOC120351040 [Nilaparvata lugens]
MDLLLGQRLRHSTMEMKTSIKFGNILVWTLLIIQTTKCESMDQGIAFEKLQDTIISENEWRIVLDFDMSEMQSEITIMGNMYDNLLVFKNMSKKVCVENVEFEYDRVYGSLKSYETDVNDLFKLLPESDRTKRGLVNAGGYMLKWLFGTPTTDDLDHVNSKVEELKELNGILLSSRQTQLTLMKDMNSKLILNTKAINEIMTKLSIAHNEFVPSDDSKLADDMMSQFLFVLKFTTMLRHLDQTIDEAKLRVIEFRQALELVSAGRVSSKLLAPHDFVNILGNIRMLYHLI